MQRVLSTYLFSKRKLVPELLTVTARAGFDAIELFCARGHFDFHTPQPAHELANWLADRHLSLHTLHAPTERDSSATRESGVPLSICDPERVRRLEAVDEIKRALDVAEVAPFPILVLHFGTSRDPADGHHWDAGFSSLEHLAVFAKQRGVTIALENTPGELATPDNLTRFIRETRLSDLRLCFDIGHAHLAEGVEKSFETMREFVLTSHVHDNAGEKDDHLLPYEGTIPWEAALQAMAGGTPGAPKLPMVLELRDPSPAGTPLDGAALGAMLENARRVLDKLEQGFAGKS